MAQRRKNGNGNGRRNNNGNRRPRQRVTRRMQAQTNSASWSNRGNLRRPNINTKFVERGSDFLGPLTVKAGANITTASDRILLGQSISPSAFPGTRLTQLAPLWERYRFRRFKLRWVPAVPKTVACQLIVYQDTDPLDDPSVIPDPDTLVRQATAQTGSQQFNFISPMAIELAQRADDQLYYTGPDKQNERFSRQGNFYIIQVTDPLNFNGEALTSDFMAGSLYVDWECEFQIAQINPGTKPAGYYGPLKYSGPNVFTFTDEEQTLTYSGSDAVAFLDKLDSLGNPAALSIPDMEYSAGGVSVAAGMNYRGGAFNVTNGQTFKIPARSTASGPTTMTIVACTAVQAGGEESWCSWSIS